MKTNTIIKASMSFALSLLFVCSSFAQEEAAAEAETKTEPKKVDVQNLERKYWAPKDKKFKVVQNRTYTKTKKIALSVMPSLMLNEEYSSGYGVDVGVGYFFNDQWGLEAEYQYISLDDNDLQKSVINLNGFADHGKATGYFGVTGKWMPFYAKMSFLGTKIVYFDLSLGLSLGMLSYDQQKSNGERYVTGGTPASTKYASKSAMAFGFEVSQSFYLSKKFLLRVDYKQRFYNEELVVGGTTTPGADKGDRLEDSISLNLGVTYLF